MKLAAALILMSLTESAFSAADNAELTRMSSRFAPTEIRVDTSHLSPGDKSALAELVRAARILDDIFLDQLWNGNHAMLAKLKQDTSPLGHARLAYSGSTKDPGPISTGTPQSSRASRPRNQRAPISTLRI